MTHILKTLGFCFQWHSPSLFSPVGVVQQDPEEVQEEFPLKGEGCCLKQILSEYPTANTFLALHQASQLQDSTPCSKPLHPRYHHSHWVMLRLFWRCPTKLLHKEQQQPCQQSLLPCRQDTYTDLSFESA